MTVAVTIALLKYTFFIIQLCHYLVLCPWVRAHFYIYLRALTFVVFCQHPLMVQIASSSKSNHSQAKSARPPFKTGPPAKKLVAASSAKLKQTKRQSIKKYAHTGNFFC